MSRITKPVFLFTPLVCMVLLLSSCNPELTQKDTAGNKSRNGVAPEFPVETWIVFLSSIHYDSSQFLPAPDSEPKQIGLKHNVYGLFDRWKLQDSVTAGRGRNYVKISNDCENMIEHRFVLTSEQWQNQKIREEYYQSVNHLIDTISTRLLSDFGEPFTGTERDFFLRALKTLAWQESRWQHYLRYENWIFVLVSGGSYNKLDDWGITQVARSSFHPDILLNKTFFDRRGYCSISASLYYGFLEYYICYLWARDNPENGLSIFNKIIGAYNLYSSGFSSVYYRLNEKEDHFKQYQINAMGGFKDWFVLEPWKKYSTDTFPK